MPHVYEALGFAEFLWIHFDGGDSKRFYREITEKGFGCPVFRPEHPVIIEEKLKNIISVRRYEQFCSGYEDSLQIYGLLMLLCGNGTVSLPTEMPAEDSMANVIRYIGEHLSEDLSVGMLADLAGLSESHFTNTFTAQNGLSPKRFREFPI